MRTGARAGPPRCGPCRGGRGGARRSRSAPIGSRPHGADGGPAAGPRRRAGPPGRCSGRARNDRVQVFLVCGGAGIGKSNLLEAALGQLPGQGWLSASGQCPESEGAPPGHAWLDLLPAFAQAALPDPCTDELAPLLAPGVLTGAGQPDGSPARRFRLHQALLGRLRDTVLRRPSVIVVDDLHRGDEESVELFLLCAERLRDVPLLLVGSFRAGEGDMTVGSRYGDQLRPSSSPFSNVAMVSRASISVLEAGQGRGTGAVGPQAGKPKPCGAHLHGVECSWATADVREGQKGVRTVICTSSR
ncbi:AAA family ATPase [Streptomyces sp. NPDC093094]|uniref:AAA family ATPase n=1 Tax=Streptomyces sp. NPDC093094 TaxID=3366026 RepID=UPI00382FC2ED